MKKKITLKQALSLVLSVKDRELFRLKNEVRELKAEVEILRGKLARCKKGK